MYDIAEKAVMTAGIKELARNSRYMTKSIIIKERDGQEGQGE